MKKYSNKQRCKDVNRELKNKARSKQSVAKPKLHVGLLNLWKDTKRWIDEEKEKGLLTSLDNRYKNAKRNILIIHLPEKMNFSSNYEETVQCITAIRKLVELHEKFKYKNIPKKSYKLGRVSFDELQKVSTSAALVLTAEMSRWDTSVRNKLKPQVSKWNKKVYEHFEQLGFFDLFRHKPKQVGTKNPNLNIVRYIKGQCGDSEDTKSKKKMLKTKVIEIVGNSVPKWTLLHSGISEAVTNVSHHAYPNNFSCQDKSWYLTGSFNKETKDLKIAFYDQGVGIPNTLPTSKIKEKVLGYLAELKIFSFEESRDSVLLKAAVSIDRTSTAETDRGKGLQDLLDFTRERGEGYLSILSYHGLYKCQINGGSETITSDTFVRPILGTLIIWNVNLNY